MPVLNKESLLHRGLTAYSGHASRVAVPRDSVSEEQQGFRLYA